MRELYVARVIKAAEPGLDARLFFQEKKMHIVHAEVGGIEKILKRQESELIQVLQKRDGIEIAEKSPELMDEIQYASERELAIRNADRESSLLREVRAALRRIHDGAFGTCVECELAISPKRLKAVPWASRCIQCQDAADRQETTESIGDTVAMAA
jgi:DnaK suppressor protein